MYLTPTCRVERLSILCLLPTELISRFVLYYQRGLQSLRASAKRIIASRACGLSHPGKTKAHKFQPVHPPPKTPFCVLCSRPIVPIDRDILVREIARPVCPLGLTDAEIHIDDEVLVLEQPRGARLIHGLRLAAHQQREHAFVLGGRGLGRHERDIRAGGHDAVGRGRQQLGRGVANGTQDAAPVGVLAVQGGLDERGARDGAGDGTGVGFSGRVAHADGDELRRALAVPHHEVRERLREGGQDAGHGEVVFGERGGDDGCRERGGGGGAVGENGDCVVRRAVAVDGDAVEGFVDGAGEQRVQGLGADGRVRAHDAQQRGHVRVDHACSLGHAGQSVLDALVLRAGEGECRGEQLGKCVGGADGLCGRQPGVVVVVQGLIRRGDLRQDLGDGQALADHASRHHQAGWAELIVLLGR